MGLLLAGSNAYATCTPNVTNTSNSSTVTLSATANGDCVENSGTIEINSWGTNGIYLGNYNTVTVNNSGVIETDNVWSSGIRFGGNTDIVNNSGTIRTRGIGSPGIYSEGISLATINNTGTIETTSSQSSGIYSQGVSSTTITNSGSIITSDGYSHGIYSSGASSTITNSGTITTSGEYGYGILLTGAANTINNSGTITTSSSHGWGIYSISSNATINNSGTVRATNSGSIAIALANVNNTVNLYRGSVIVGDIYAAPTYGAGARLNINLGAGASYAYQVTGSSWTVSDLDNRPMVTGSAYAAGIGAQETASEMLYQRTSSITSALDRRLRSHASNETYNQPYWLDVYYADVSRNAGANYSTRTAFSNHNYGMTAGFKLPYEMTPLELVINAEQSHLNIDGSNQKVNSTGLMVGVLAPNISDVQGAALSAKALIGFANNDGDRKVMTNSLSYDGSRQIKSDYDSFYATVGTALTKLHPINDRLTLDAIVGLDLNINRIESYAETDYFTWNDRTLTQLQSRVQAGLDYKLWGDKGSVFARAGVERRDLIGGKTQDYAINGTSVSFNTNNKNDTYLTAQVGIKAQLEKRVQLFGVLNTLHSEDSVDSLSGNIGLRADF